MWSRQGMMRLIIYYVQLDIQDIHDKNYECLHNMYRKNYVEKPYKTIKRVAISLI